MCARVGRRDISIGETAACVCDGREDGATRDRVRKNPESTDKDRRARIISFRQTAFVVLNDTVKALFLPVDLRRRRTYVPSDGAGQYIIL